MAVFHLKYRPTKFSELDLSDVADELVKILQAKDGPQAFLLAGPKGSGKTSAARIIARAVNCLKPDGVEPCGQCVNCKEITRGNSLDVMEIDAASNRGIDDIRTLRDNVYLLPSRLKRKIFIIDEVHMLTKEAFNALLKLIEEPPKHTIFILCTTDPQKIPETVMSRLVKVDFRKGTKIELERSLRRIAEGEKIKIDKEVANLIVAKSDGSFRNLQRSFNEMVMSLGENLTEDKVKEYYEKKGGDYDFAKLETDLSLGETEVILKRLEEMAEKGVDFGWLRQSLIEFLRKKWLSFWNLSDEKPVLDKVSLERLMELLIEAGKWEKETEISQLPIELAIVKFGGEESKKIEPPKIEQPKKAVGSKISIEDLENKWNEVLVAVKPANHSVEAFLRAARPIAVEGREVTLEVYYSFHKEKLEEPRNRKIVEEGFVKVFGMELAMNCVLSKEKKKPALVIEKKDEGAASGSKTDITDVAKEIFG